MIARREIRRVLDGARQYGGYLLAGGRPVGSPERLTQGQIAKNPNSFSPDGRYLLFTQNGVTYDIGMVSLQGKHDIRPLLSEPTYNETNAEVSPNGKWLAYESNESGRTEVYVRAFRQVENRLGQISVAGGTRPLWSRDRRELFYYILPGVIMSVPLEADDDFRPGTPHVIFEGPYSIRD